MDDYVSGLFLPADVALHGALECSKAAGLPEIQVSAAAGKFLQLLARLQRAERILEASAASTKCWRRNLA